MKWYTKKFVTSNSNLPTKHGIYAFGVEHAVCGLIVENDICYVGQATNLRRRLNQHAPWSETNPGLDDFMKSRKKDIRVWYTSDLPRSNLDKVERKLIRSLKPIYNRITYTGGKES
jgi:excinuclease UvrABC nuclease subunit